MIRERRILRTRVELLGEGGLLSGSGVLGENPLGGGLVDFLDSDAHGGSLILRAGFEGSVGLLDLRLQLGEMCIRDRLGVVGMV